MILDVLSPPPGPNTPFGTPSLFVIDSIRVLMLAAGLTMLTMTIVVMRRAHTLGQFTRLGSTAFFVINIMGTEFDHIGDYAHWRFFGGILALCMGVWGLWSAIRWEEPSRLVELDKDGQSA